jgi:hypothetical protein
MLESWYKRHAEGKLTKSAEANFRQLVRSAIYLQERAEEYLGTIDSLARKVEAMERDRYVVWEGDESEGRWRCLMCGEKREGDEDTGPEGVEHLYNCGRDGAAIWVYGRLLTAAQEEQRE